MASRLEEDLRCPVCQDVFRHPVLLSCSHSFCKACLTNWWKHNQTQRKCPVCKKTSAKGEPPCNLALKNLCEAFVVEREQKISEGLCSLHAEKLKLFCLDHQQPVCLVCRDSERHADHRFRPVSEAARCHKKELQENLEALKEKLKAFEQFDRRAGHIEVQARYTKRQVKEQFNKLHQFLDAEEEARLAAVKDDEEQKVKMMEVGLETLCTEMAALSDTVRATEEELGADDVLFLHNYKTTAERVQQCLLLKNPQLLPGTMIDQAKHLGNLGFSIWRKMKDQVNYSPVILDPNTAHEQLVLSEDLTSASKGGKQELPDNPERLGTPGCVLGSTGLDSGNHGWEVVVGDSSSWSVGLLAESAKRKGTFKSGSWAVTLHKGVYTAQSRPGQLVQLPAQKIRTVRVDLDWRGGELSFWDLDNDKLLHTFKHTFTEKLFPFFSTDDGLKVLPLEIYVDF